MNITTSPSVPSQHRPWQHYSPGIWLLILLLGLTITAITANAEEEPLPPEQAFQFSASMQDADTLLVQWNIADSYYLYRHKLKFNSNTPGITLGEPAIPDGKKKTDDFFGEVETYRHLLAVKIPVKRTGNTIGSFALNAESQGCADIGICYPPQQHQATLVLPALATSNISSITPSTPADGSTLDLINTLDNNFGLQQEEFLPPDMAFPFSGYIEGSPENGTAIVARWNISKGYYLYRQKFSFSIVEGPSGLALGTPALPKGKIKQDEFFGEIEAYYGDTTVQIPVLSSNTSTAGKKLVVRFEYQGCAEAGICYPPISKNIDFQLPGKLSSGNQPSQTITKTTTKAATTEQVITTTETTEKNPDISNKKKLLALLAAFGVGLLLTFTPCVLPMIPILSSIIIGQGGEKITKLRGGMLSLTYVLGTSVTYTTAGVMAGKTGDQLQAYFQNAWAIGTLSAILVLMAISMFGIFELQMPSFIQSKLQNRNQRGGKFAGVFVMGIISSLIVGACVSPLLITALGLAITTKDPVLGGGIMFAISMGMGVVLVAIGIGAGTLLPKAGDWMENVKHVFGVLLLVVAIYLLGNLPEVPVLLLWAALLIVTAIYLGATEGIPAGSSGWHYFWKGTGIVMLLWGVLALLGGMAGNRNILNPLPLNLIGSNSIAVAGAPGQQTPIHTELFEHVKTMDQISTRMREARTQNKPLLIDFFASWCTDCLRMERSTFKDPRVSALLDSEFITLQVDVTDPDDPESRAIKKHFNVFGPPAMLFFSASGKPLESFNFYGYKAPDEFYSHAKQALNGE